MELEGHELEEIKCEIDIDEFQLKVEDIKHEPEDEQHEDDVDFTLLDPDLDSSDSPVSNLLASNVLLTSKEGVYNIVPNIAPVSTKVWKTTTPIVPKPAKINKCGFCMFSSEDFNEYLVHIHVNHNQTRWDSNKISTNIVPKPSKMNKCGLCTFIYEDLKTYMLHIQRVHNVHGYLANHHQCPHCLIYYEHFKEYEIHKFVCHRRNYQKKDIKLRSQSHQNTNMKPKGKVHLSIKNKEKHAKIDLECDICGLSGFPDSIRLKIHLKRSKVHKEKVLSDTKKHMLHSNPLIQEYNRKIIYWNQ